MAKIRPLKAWRYHKEMSADIGALLSPPFDVVSPKQREALYQNPYNSIHLSVPAGQQPHQQAAFTLARWKEEGIIQQDQQAGIYVYYQYFRLPGDAKEYCRKGFICMIEASFWEEKIVLRHENTIPGSVNDRIQLLEATQLNASPTHGLYTDPEHQLESTMDECMRNPLYQAEDFQGVRDVFGIIEDEEQIQKFVQLLAGKQIILADGHHRYESSLVYRRKMMQENTNHQGDEAYNYHLMYLTNTEAEDLRVLPTHRLVSGIHNFGEGKLLEASAPYFDIYAQENPCDIPEIIAGKAYTFGLLLKEQCYKLKLKEQWQGKIEWSVYQYLKQLDIVALHYFFLEKVLGIPKDEQRSAREIEYERSFANCLYQVSTTEKAQIALITNGVSIEQIKQICYAGHLLPQKSTYFYPKAICGFLFASIDQDEF